MPKLSRQDLDRALAKSEYTDSQKDQIRAEWAKQYTRERIDSVKRGIEALPDPLRFTAKLAGTVGAGVASYGDEALFGIPSKVAAAATSPITALARGVPLGEAYQANRETIGEFLGGHPVASGAGRIAANFAPTPISAVGTLGGRLAGMQKLAKGAAESFEAGRLGLAAAKQMASAWTGAAGAIALTGAVEGAVESGKEGVAKSIRDTFDTLTSPNLTTALTTALGLVPTAGRWLSKSDAETIKMIEAGKRLIPGFKPSAAEYQDKHSFVGSAIDYLSKTPAGRYFASQWLRRNYYEPMREAVTDLRKAFGSGDQTRDLQEAAKGVRELVGGGVDVSGRLTPGSLQTRAATAGHVGFGAGGNAPVEHRKLTAIGKALDYLDARRTAQFGTEGARGEELSAVMSDARNLLSKLQYVPETKSTNITVQMLDNLRQRLGDIAGFGSEVWGKAGAAKAFSRADAREARKLYHVLRAVEQQSSPHVDKALNAIRALRVEARKIGPLMAQGQLDDIPILARTFEAKDFRQRWAAMERQMPTETIQALRGAYLGDFLDVVTRYADGKLGKVYFSAPSVDALWSGQTRFRREVFDAVLGSENREKIWEMAQASWAVRQGFGRAEGSETAGRMIFAQEAKDARELAEAAEEFITNPVLTNSLWRTVIGKVGGMAFAKSVLDGKIGQALIRASEGQPLGAQTSVPRTALGTQEIQQQLLGNRQ